MEMLKKIRFLPEIKMDCKVQNDGNDICNKSLVFRGDISLGKVLVAAGAALAVMHAVIFFITKKCCENKNMCFTGKLKKGYESVKRAMR